jgi:hypothetical protein
MSAAPTPTAPTEEVFASCSFCEKANNEVAKLVAGPGVFICNECVELCAAIIADTAPGISEQRMKRGEYLDRPAEEILTRLPALARSAARVEGELATWVSQLREQGTDWPAIATALDVSVDAARQRFEAPRPGFETGPPA